MNDRHMSLSERFGAHVAQSGLIPANSLVVLGYSGGPDSTCLLHLMQRIGMNVIAAHLHHGQREEADEELSKCAAFAQQLGVPFVSGRANIPQMCKELKIGIEEAGRLARYEFFQSTANQTGANLIATAHTRDDNIETVLLNLTRGTGLAGLGGIPARRENLVRPLLPFSREETRAYCKEHGLWTCEDPANTDEKFSRVRIRLNVLPELRRINLAVEAAIERLAHTAREESEYLDAIAARALEQAELRPNGELSFLTEESEFVFSRDAMRHLPAVLLRRALRLAMSAMGGALDSMHTNSACEGIVGQDSGAVTSPGGSHRIEWRGKEVVVLDSTAVPAFRFSLTCPGETISDQLGWKIKCAETNLTTRSQIKRVSLEGFLACDKLKGQLFFRNRKAGDQMQPLGFSGQRKLSDLIGESQLTWAARQRLPIVCDMLGPVWVPGVCLSERVRPEASSDRVLRLTFGPLRLHSNLAETACSP